MDVRYFESNSYDPYYNLGLEKYLFENVREDEVILYLWQNEKTIVCGRNQNVFKECNLTALEDFGGRIARRLSGGGAVYHDLGNLNFTFIARAENYDLAKQLSVITTAVTACGVETQVTGRNDITAHGKKFSGNAFQKRNGTHLHHGTIMIDVDTSHLSDVLNVSREKLKSKGVDSVRSRVVNLCELKPDITVDGMKEALKSAFFEIYASTKSQTNAPTNASIVSDNSLPAKTEILISPLPGDEELKNYRDFFASHEWLYGEKFDFSNSVSERFTWGEIEICVNVQGDKITDAQIYSDSLQPDFISHLASLLKEQRYDATELSTVTEEAVQLFPECTGLAKDIQTLFKKSI